MTNNSLYLKNFHKFCQDDKFYVKSLTCPLYSCHNREDITLGIVYVHKKVGNR